MDRKKKIKYTILGIWNTFWISYLIGFAVLLQYCLNHYLWWTGLFLPLIFALAIALIFVFRYLVIRFIIIPYFEDVMK